MGRRDKEMDKEKNIFKMPFFGRVDKVNEFFSKYEKIEKEIFYIVNYHGAGGIGKSWLCRELSREHNRRFPDAKNFILDLEELNNSGNRVEVLSSLMMKFVEICGYKFPRFMYALTEYYKSRGLSNSGPELDRLQDNPLINTGLDLLALVLPNVVTLGKAFETFNLQKKVEEIKCDPMMSKLSGMSSEEISEELVPIFATELSEYTIKEKFPIIIFWDTYEKVQNCVLDTKSARVTEAWLYAPDGLMSSVQNVMWVIAGQREIQAGKYNAKWDDEQYCLHRKIEAFISKQTEELLKSINITEPAIVEKIWEETQGIPVALETCARIYYSKDNPTTDDFNGVSKNEISRLIGGLAYEDKDIIDILACMKTWKEEDIFCQFPFISNDRYKKLKKLSLIEGGLESCSMNKNIQSIIFKDCDDVILNYCVNYYGKKATDDSCSISVQNEYLKKKIKLQINIIKSKDNIEKKLHFLQLYGRDILEFIQKNLYNVVVFEEIENEILDGKINELFIYPYNKTLCIYKAYQYIIGGDYVCARRYIKEKGLLYEYTQLDRDTQALLYCILTDAMDDEHIFYEEVLKNLLDKVDLQIEQKRFSMHVNHLIMHEKYLQAKKYIEICKDLLDAVDIAREPLIKCMFLMDNSRLLLEDSQRDEAEACLQIAEKIVKSHENTNDKDLLLMYSDICNSFVKNFGRKNYVAKDIELLERLENKSAKYKMRLAADYKLNVGRQSLTSEFVYCLKNAIMILKDVYVIKNEEIEKQLREWLEEAKLHYYRCNVLDYKLELIELGHSVSSFLDDGYENVLNRTVFLEYSVSTLIQKYQMVNPSDDLLENALEILTETEENIEFMWEHSGGMLEPEEYWEHKECIAELKIQIYKEKILLAEAEYDMELMKYYEDKAEEAKAEYEFWNNAIYNE